MIKTTDIGKAIQEIMQEIYMPAIRNEIAEMIKQEKNRLFLLEETHSYLALLLEAQRSGHACHDEIGDVIRDLHKVYGYKDA